MATQFDPELMAALDQVAPMQQPQLPDDLMSALDQVAPPQQRQGPASPSLEGLKMPVPKSTGDELLHLLSYLSYPLHGVAGAIESGISDDPKESAVGGFVKGIKGERKTRMKDVLGLDEGQPDDTWPEWLQKEALNFAVDIPFDPLTYIGSPAKAAGVVGKGLKAVGVPEGRSLISAGLRKAGGDKALDYLAGTKAWAMFGQRAPDTDALRGLNEIAMQAKRRGSTVGLEDAAIAANKALLEKFPNLDRETLFHAIEDPASNPELAAAIELYAPVAQEQGKQFDRYSQLKGYFTGKEPGRQAEPYVPHISKERGEWKPRSREIRDFIDPETGEVLHTGKLADKRTGGLLEATGDGYYNLTDPITGDIRIVQEVPAKLKTTKSVAKNIEFQTDPVLAQFFSGKGYGHRAQFLDYLKSLEEAKFIRKVGKEDALEKGEEILSFANLDLKDKWAAKKAVARNVEQQFGRLYNPDSPLGTISTALDQMINRTKGGELLKETTGWFKRNVLGTAGWVTGNIGSNVGLQYTGGMNPLVMGARAFQGEKIRRGVGEAVIDGLDNKTLLRELRDRGIGINQFTDADKSYLSGATPKTAERLKGLKVPGKVANATQTGANVMGKWNDMFLSVGGKAEDNAKIAMAVDYLKKHADEWSNPANRESLLDKAAQYAHDALIDYGGGTPWEQRIAKHIIPFEPWQRGITSQTAKLVLNDPARLARMDRATAQITEPLTADEKQKADAWVRESAPIKGLFGKSFDSMADDLGIPKLPRGERMMLLGRYLPQGFVEQLTSRPMDALTSSVNPFLKAPYEILANRNTFKDRPIDQLADTTGSMFTRPLVGGGPYSSASTQTFGTTLPAGYDYLKSISPASRHLNELDMLGQATGLWGDKYKAEAPSLGEFGAWYATGGKFYPYDAARYAKNRKREQRETEGRMKSQAKWAAKNGDYETAQRLNQQLYDYKANRRKTFSSGEY